MSNYDGIFMRSKLGQGNTIPKTTTSSSPDIIPYGIAPVSDPQKFFRDNYDTDPGKTLLAEQTNYVYLRGKNYSSDRIEDTGDQKPQLWWVKSSLLTYPDKWNEITETPTGEPNTLLVDGGAVGVATQPYIWVPENVGSGYHYCMIARVPSPGYPNTIPDTVQISDFASFIAQNGGIAWRNVSVQNASTLTLSNEKLDYDQGTQASKITFTLKCTNIPINSIVSFSGGAAGPTPPIYLPPTVVTSDTSFNTGIDSDVPANYSSKIYVNFQAPSGVTTLPEGAKFIIEASYPSNEGDPLYTMSKTAHELGMPHSSEVYRNYKLNKERLGISSALTKHEMRHLEQLRKLEAAGPTRYIIVGSNTYEWKSQ